MLSISLETPTRTPRLLFRKRWKRQIPTTWEEMTTRQKTQAVIAFSVHDPEEKTKALEALALSWLRVPQIVRNAIDPAHLYEIIEHIEDVHIDKMPPASIIPDHKAQRAIEPQLTNITNLEYALADEYYTEFFKTGEIKYLHKLTATIYAPIEDNKRKTHETRASTADNTTVVAKWPDHIHLSTLYFFSQSKKMIHNTYGRWLFEAPEEDGNPEAHRGASHSRASQDPFGWWGIFMDLAELGTFGNFNQVLQTNLHNTLIYLTKKKQQEMKQKSLKQTNIV